ncbi:MAG: hypothetical protein GX579_04500 [Chloroflexi bacterium]|nr:hypothetical protein [Chloroflexota bacterium]
MKRLYPALTGVTLFLMLLALLGAPRPAVACSCLPPPPPLAAREQAVAVFAGTVTAVDDFSLSPLRSSADPIHVTFAVSDVWKGEVTTETVITTARDSASCGFEFSTGQDYLVYAYAGEGGLQTNLCSRTALLSDAGEDLTAFGAGEAPLPGASGDALPSVWLVVLPLALIGVFLLAGLLLWRRRRRAVRA